MPDPAAIIAVINSRHGTHFRVLDARAGGESGAAHRVADDADIEYLLKFGAGEEFRLRQAVAITSRLREAGYPVPEFVVHGTDNGLNYVVQKIMPGKSGAVLTPRLLRRLVELNGLQSGIAAEFGEAWPARIIESIEHGFHDWCVHDSLMGHSVETRAIMSELKGLPGAVQSQAFGTWDAVHFDFTTANILVDGGEISGVIDWNGCCAGDRAFDLVTLAFYALEDPLISQSLLQSARDISGPDATRLYLAHLILRQLDWSIRHHDETTVTRYLGISRAALKVIQDLGGAA